MVSIAFAAPAVAQDACLTGGSTLGDQRALTDLRTATDAACPCASFTGGPHGDRRAYQRCARTVFAPAFTSGMVRRECRNTVRRDLHSTLCGTNRVACGGFRAGAADPVSCRLAAPSGNNACRGRGTLVEHVCAGETHCSDVVERTAGTCVDPRQPGPYGVGVQVIQMVKDSVNMPGTERVLDTVIWYPTAPDAGPMDSRYRAVLDAPLNDSGAPYPILMFSHGSCGYPLQSLFLTPLLATYGFVVVATPHPGNTISEFPQCGTGAALGASALERPADIRFALDQMLAANADPSSPFFGAIDPARIGMSGHSFGGLTTYLVVAADSRFKVAVPMAPAVPGTPKLQIPSLTMLGQIDAVVSLPPIRTAYADAQPPKVLVEIEDAGHYAFSDLCFPSADCNPPTTRTQGEANELVLRWVLPFLERYLVGNTSYEPFFDAVPPEVQVSQER